MAIAVHKRCEGVHVAKGDGSCEVCSLFIEGPRATGLDQKTAARMNQNFVGCEPVSCSIDIGLPIVFLRRGDLDIVRLTEINLDLALSIDANRFDVWIFSKPGVFEIVCDLFGWRIVWPPDFIPYEIFCA